ncbi:MAG TPA: hypothetical protein VGB53_15415 [Rubricoccaceae bacterium]|jgi:hypothetical protein
MPDRPFRPASAVFRLVALGLLGLGCISLPPDSGWTLLGERTVGHRAERDEIAVGPRVGAFDRIKLVVRGRAVTFHDVEVHYVNGTRQDVAVRQRILVGDETRAVDLAGSDRRIARVVIVCETHRTRDPSDPRAVVALYGWR